MKEEQKSVQELLNFGIINIDKPVGPTSFSVSDFVRKQLKLKKTSHFGTLDPMVSGVLPIALGRACKLTGFFLGHDKTYIGIMRVHKEIDKEKLQEIINKNFLGKIKQTPPKKSRVKRVEREREVKRWELLEQKEKNFLFIAEVQGGTYIRKICSDLGELIGGAHMAELRRIKAGIFDESNAVNLYDFDKAVEEFRNGKEEKLRNIIIPAEEGIKKIMPNCECKEDVVKKLLTGKPIYEGEISEVPEELFAVFHKERFIGIYKRVDEAGIIARAEFVFN